MEPTLLSLKNKKILIIIFFSVIIYTLKGYKMFHYASSSFPGLELEDSVKRIYQINTQKTMSFLNKKDNLSCDDFKNKIQLCPQHKGYLSDECIDYLQSTFPDTQFYLHANVRVSPNLIIKDASNLLKDKDSFVAQKNQSYFSQLKIINQKLNSSYYTLHAGYKKNCSQEEMLKNVLDLEKLLKVEVFIEGLYPSRDNYLMSNLDEYEMVAKHHGFVLDLSHLNIVFNELAKEIDFSWIKDMILDKNCREIHISENDGKKDQHCPIKKNAIILDIFNDLIFRNKMLDRINRQELTIFSEENFLYGKIK